MANTKAVGGLVAAAVVLTALTTCSSWTSSDRLAAFARLNGSGDYFLVKRSLGVDDRVGIFYGFANNLEACQEFVDLYNQQYPAAKFACIPVD